MMTRRRFIFLCVCVFVCVWEREREREREKPMIARSTALWANRNLLQHLLRDRGMHGWGMLHATTAAPDPSFRVSWRSWRHQGHGLQRKCWMDNIKIQRVAVPAHARTADNGLHQKRLEEDLCTIICRDPLITQSVKELNWNWTEWQWLLCHRRNVQVFLQKKKKNFVWWK